MNKDIDFDAVLGKYRSDPFEYADIVTRHTGRVRFKVKEGDEVKGTSGEWHHVPGSQLFVLSRERNPKSIHATTNGIVANLRADLEGNFVEADETVMTIKHPLTKREIIESILRKVLNNFVAPEKAKYFFSMDIQARIEKLGQRSVTINPGDEVFTMSLMKRDIPVYYEGEPGIIHSVYFKAGVSVEQGEPLIGICPPDTLPLIQKIITRVKAEWE